MLIALIPYRVTLPGGKRYPRIQGSILIKPGIWETWVSDLNKSILAHSLWERYRRIQGSILIKPGIWETWVSDRNNLILAHSLWLVPGSYYTSGVLVSTVKSSRSLRPVSKMCSGHNDWLTISLARRPRSSCALTFNYGHMTRHVTKNWKWRKLANWRRIYFVC